MRNIKCSICLKCFPYNWYSFQSYFVNKLGVEIVSSDFILLGCTQTTNGKYTNRVVIVLRQDIPLYLILNFSYGKICVMFIKIIHGYQWA